MDRWKVYEILKNRYAESFLKIDFVLGEYAIEEV